MIQASSVINQSELSKEQSLLSWFGENFKGLGYESEHEVLGVKHHCVSFFTDDPMAPKSLAAHGSHRVRSVAVLKAICEFIERQAYRSFFEKKLPFMVSRLDGLKMIRHDFPAPKSSNGWAVHFDRDLARKNAYEEALERHILLASFLKDGWNGFQVIDRRISRSQITLSLVSRYNCNGYGAGLVLIKDKSFPGIAMGYLSDLKDHLLTSSKWEHALFEAFNYLERVKSFGLEIDPQNDISILARDWLLTPWEEPVWKNNYETKDLPHVDPWIFETPAQKLSSCAEGMKAAFVFGGGLIPLYVPARIKVHDVESVSKALSTLNLLFDPSVRIPVL